MRRVLACVAAALTLGGCTAPSTPGVAGPQSPATPAAAPSAAAVGAPTPDTSVAPTLTLREPVGACEETATTIEPPTNVEQTCTYGRMVIGHTLRATDTYLSRVVAQLAVGDLVEASGVTYRVAAITSTPKTDLPDVMYDPTAAELWLVTCDPASGYTDGHAHNNLIVTLYPQGDPS